jgi:hypothetical protein
MDGRSPGVRSLLAALALAPALASAQSLPSGAAPHSLGFMDLRESTKEIERQTAALDGLNGKEAPVAGRSGLAEAPHLADEPPLGVGHWLNRQAGQPG